MSTARFNTLTDAAGANSMPVADINQGRAKAWVNINGTGTIATRDSFNIASIVDVGVGNYAANFTAARPSVDYSPNHSGRTAANTIVTTPQQDANTTSQFTWFNVNSAFAAIDVTWANSQIFGDPS